MNKELYDFLLDIDIDADDPISALHSNKEEADAIINRIVKLANTDHDAECSDKNCPGQDGFLIKNMKAMLASHEEYETSLVIAIIAGVYTCIGDRVSRSSFSGDENGDVVVKRLESMFGKGNVMISDKLPDGLFKDPEDDGKF